MIKSNVVKVFILLLLGGTSCIKSNKNSENDLDTISSLTPVTYTHVVKGNIQNQITLMATSSYQNKFAFFAPTTGYILKISVLQGDHLKLGQTIATMESQEHHALGKSALLSSNNFTIKALANGYLTELVQQDGNYIAEGSEIGVIADESSFVFLINVPYEYLKYVKKGSRCKLVLPNDSIIPATIGNPLTTMDVSTQTQQVILFTPGHVFPEGLIARVKIDVENTNPADQLLPIGAVQCDDNMQNYWIMHLVNDSLAVQIPVQVGARSRDSIEIVSPRFAPDYRIVEVGSYQLPDSAGVEIIKP